LAAFFLVAFFAAFFLFFVAMVYSFKVVVREKQGL
jgi:hypothetical protein